MKDQKIEDLKNEFLEAAANGDARLVKKMLKKGPKHDLLHLDFKEGDDVTPLHLACENRHLEVVKLLLDNGASENKEMISSALPYSIDYEEFDDLFEILEELLKHGAIVNFTMQNGNSIFEHFLKMKAKESSNS